MKDVFNDSNLSSSIESNSDLFNIFLDLVGVDNNLDFISIAISELYPRISIVSSSIGLISLFSFIKASFLAKMFLIGSLSSLSSLLFLFISHGTD